MVWFWKLFHCYVDNLLTIPVALAVADTVTSSNIKWTLDAPFVQSCTVRQVGAVVVVAAHFISTVEHCATVPVYVPHVTWLAIPDKRALPVPRIGAKQGAPVPTLEWREFFDNNFSHFGIVVRKKLKSIEISFRLSCNTYCTSTVNWVCPHPLASHRDFNVTELTWDDPSITAAR